MELSIQTFLFKISNFINFMKANNVSVAQLCSLVNKTMELYLKFLVTEEVNMYEKKRGSFHSLLPREQS